MQAHDGSKQPEDVPEAILHPASRSLFSYWDWLRDVRSAPCRQEIDLRALTPVLPWVGIIERHDALNGRPQRHCWRLAGTGIARLWGNGLAGRQVADDWPEVYRRALVRALDGVCDRRQAFVARLRAISARGDAIGIEIFGAPVETSGGDSVQCLCTAAPFREPHWLGRIPLVEVELTTLVAVGNAPLLGEIEGAPNRPQPATPFRLIQGGRGD